MGHPTVHPSVPRWWNPVELEKRTRITCFRSLSCIPIQLFPIVSIFNCVCRNTHLSYIIFREQKCAINVQNRDIEALNNNNNAIKPKNLCWLFHFLLTWIHHLHAGDRFTFWHDSNAVTCFLFPVCSPLVSSAMGRFRMCKYARRLTVFCQNWPMRSE